MHRQTSIVWIVLSGYRVTLYCSGAGYVDGYGSNLGEANQQEARLLAGLRELVNRECSGTSTRAVSGGHSLRADPADGDRCAPG